MSLTLANIAGRTTTPSKAAAASSKAAPPVAAAAPANASGGEAPPTAAALPPVAAVSPQMLGALTAAQGALAGQVAEAAHAMVAELKPREHPTPPVMAPPVVTPPVVIPPVTSPPPVTAPPVTAPPQPAPVSPPAPADDPADASAFLALVRRELATPAAVTDAHPTLSAAEKAFRTAAQAQHMAAIQASSYRAVMGGQAALALLTAGQQSALALPSRFDRLI